MPGKLCAPETAVKPTSPMSWKLMGRALAGLGDGAGAADARDKAAALLDGVHPIARDNTGLRDSPVFIPGGCLL